MVELAEKIGSTQSAISAWESGKSDPNPKYQNKLKEILNIDISQPIASEPAGAYCTHHTDIDKMYNTLSATIASLVESNKILTETNAKIVASMLEHYSKI